MHMALLPLLATYDSCRYAGLFSDASNCDPTFSDQAWHLIVLTRDLLLDSSRLPAAPHTYIHTYIERDIERDRERETERESLSELKRQNFFTESAPRKQHTVGASALSENLLRHLLHAVAAVSLCLALLNQRVDEPLRFVHALLRACEHHQRETETERESERAREREITRHG